MQSIDIIEEFNLNFFEGNILKYLLRYKKKNGKEDLEKCEWYLKRLINKEPKPQLENHNFRINSESWNKIEVDGGTYLENQTKDAWELPDGEQLFTWPAAMRETKKAGKRMPTDEEFFELLKTKEDMSNLVFTGYRNTNGNYSNRGTGTYYWSSTASSDANAWRRYLYSGFSSVYRHANNKANGFSVRCLKD